MINDRLFVMLGIMMLVPMIFVFLAVDPVTATVGTMAVNLVMLLYMRKTFRNMAGSLFGSKSKFVCIACNGTKFDSKGSCYRCGSRQRRLS